MALSALNGHLVWLRRQHNNKQPHPLLSAIREPDEQIESVNIRLQNPIRKPDVRMHHATLGNNVAGVAHGLDGVAVRGFAVLDLVGLGRRRQETQLAREEHQIVGRGRPVHGALSVGRQVKVVHVQAAGEHDPHAGDVVKGKLAAAERNGKKRLLWCDLAGSGLDLLAVIARGNLLARGHYRAHQGSAKEGIGL